MKRLVLTLALSATPALFSQQPSEPTSRYQMIEQLVDLSGRSFQERTKLQEALDSFDELLMAQIQPVVAEWAEAHAEGIKIYQAVLEEAAGRKSRGMTFVCDLYPQFEQPAEAAEEDTAAE